MPSLKLSAALVATAIFSMNAQAQYNIDPESVPLAIRTSWCQAQIASCPLLCLQNLGDSSSTEANDCDPPTLAYDCICGNGLTPSLANYSQTIPFFECQEFGNQCVAGCNGAPSCQSACRDSNPCGAQTPTRINTTSTSSMPATATLPAGATSGTAGVVFTGLGGSVQTSTSSTDNKKNGSQMALDLGRSYGLAVVFAGIFTGFALVV